MPVTLMAAARRPRRNLEALNSLRVADDYDPTSAMRLASNRPTGLMAST
jgi:hypothetical protein